jgi:N-acyl-D-amino-acid deacylase
MLSFSSCVDHKDKGFDILILGGKIIDGTGNSRYHGDVGIRGDKISEIGKLAKRTAKKTINAQGFIVSPGFIDVHTHCDSGLGNPGTNTNLNYITQGVTTAVTGNCGAGSSKIAETKEKWENMGIGTNAIMLIGHGTVREAVMGREPRKPTREELKKMEEIFRKAMSEGAWGITTGLQDIPSRYAQTEEIIALTRVVGEYGGIASFHQRSEEKFMVEATEESIQIAKETGVPVNIAHIKAGGKSNWGKMRKAVQLINKTRSEGISITADIYPYDKANVRPCAQHFNIPDEIEAELQQNSQNRQQYVDNLTEILRDPEKRSQIKRLTAEGAPNKKNYALMYGWDGCAIVSAKKNVHLIGKIISDLAQEQNKDPFDVLADLFIEEKDDILTSVDVMSEDDMKYAMKQDWVMFSSDGGAKPYKGEPIHPRNYGSFPRVLRKYVKEEKTITLEQAVRKMTSLPARLLQIKQRGLLLPGYKADIVIFDPEKISDKASYVDPHQYSTGMEYVLINGKMAIEDGHYNKKLNGKVLLLNENK